MLKLRRLPERRHLPVQPTQPAMQSREARSDVTQVTLEVLDVDGVEADDRREETNIGLSERVSEEVARGRVFDEVGFDPVERGEERGDGLFVGFLGGREAGFVDAVVDVVVDPFVAGVDFGAQGGGEEVEGFIFCGEEVVEFVVEHADDFGALFCRF